MSWRPLTFVLALVALMILVTWQAAAAQGDRPHHRAVAALCAADIERHCSQAGDGSLVCLARHAKGLRRPCYRALRFAAAKDGCEADYRRHCGHAPAGGGRILACLRGNADRLSGVCIRALREPAHRASVSQHEGGGRDTPDEELWQGPADPAK